MVRRTNLYSVALLAWGLVVFGLTVAVFSGKAAPLLTPAMLPLSGIAAFIAFPGGLLVAGAIAIGQLERRAWRKTGQRANLSPDGRGLFGKPDLVGTHNGRTVRARTIKRTTGGGGESGSSKSTFTVVEAELERPAEEGLVIGNREGGKLVDVSNMPVDMEVETVGEFGVVGRSSELANDVLSSRAQSALAKPSLNDTVLVGNASEVVLEAIPDSDGMITGRITAGLKSKLKQKIPGDAATVRTESKNVLLDSEEMTHQIEAVTAVADEFERAIER